jgi:hypothetical protein
MSLLSVYAHCGAVDSVSNAGLPAPNQWIQVRGRWQRFLALNTPVTEELGRAIIDGKPDDEIARLRAISYAEWHPIHPDSQLNIVNAAVHGALERSYRPVAGKHYQALRRKFDELAGRFAKCAAAVDVELPGDDTPYLTEAARDSWVSAPALAGHLDDLTYPLACAAALAGGPAELVTLDEVRITYELPLVADLGRLHRRLVYEAVESDGRTRQWGPLVKLGARLRAHPHPEQLEPYRRPEPVAVELGPGNKTRWFDPEGEIPGREPRGRMFDGLDARKAGA